MIAARWDRALDAVGARGPRSRDVLFAVVVAVLSALVLLPLLGPLASSLGVTFGSGQKLLITIIVVVQALALSWRRSRPEVCLVIVASAQVVLAAVLPVDTSLRLVAPLLAAYAAGALLPIRRLLAWVVAAGLFDFVGGGLAGWLVAPILRPLLGGTADPRSAVAASPALLVFGGLVSLASYLTPALAGVVVAGRRANLELAREQAAAAIREQAAGFEQAARAERARMARELHDIAAHHLSGLVVQAAAAERLIDTDPDAAREATRSIRAQGKEALGNLRLVVGVLREAPDPSEPGDPGAEMIGGLGVASIRRLAHDASRLGQDVVVSVEGTAGAVSAVADVTAYRVAQEALANARQHAPGAAVEVEIIFDDRRLQLIITNPPVPAPISPRRTAKNTGFGLLGMQERASLAGGSVTAGPVDGGGWRVDFGVPVHSRDLDQHLDQHLAASGGNT